MNRDELLRELDPVNPKYVTGSPEDRARARADWHRQRFIAEVMNSNLEEIPRADIAPLRFGVVEDTRTGNFYRLRRDSLVDLSFTTALAYYTDPSGLPILLERPPGPATRAELERQQAERELRQAQPKPPPRAMTR